ncbi:hypothetical protein RA2_04433 [Roseovarius sp. A-2]|nr:hypothetical protein RA2_04433 [Roseovarius sp. A-2]
MRFSFVRRIKSPLGLPPSPPEDNDTERVMSGATFLYETIMKVVRLTCHGIFPPFGIRVRPNLVRPRAFYRRWREFSRFDQGDRLVS